MIFLGPVAVKRIRALIATVLFLLSTPQKIHADFLSQAFIFLGLFAVDKLYRYGIHFVSNPGQGAEGASEKITVLPEKAAAVPVTSTAQQLPETKASQVVINTTNHHHTTTITVAGTSSANKIVMSTSLIPETTAAQPPTQTIESTQTVQPTIQQVATKPVPPTVPTAPEPKVSMPVYDEFKKICKNHYGSIGLTAALTGYLYLVYSVASLQNYLTDKKRIGFWFSDYDLNKLLLLEFDIMHDLLLQEFISVYHVTDQKSLKTAVSHFLNDMETELVCLDRYATITGRLAAFESFAGTCISPCSGLAKTCIPFAGLVLDYIPTINLHTLFFVDSTLKQTIQERISRIHYYKNIFLQSTITI